MTTETKVTFNDICEELGLSPPFLFGLSEDAASQYETFDLPKRSGGFRTISVPSAKLKRVQRLILDGLLTKFTFPPHVHGCVKGRSIVTNAAVHVDKPLVINIDLRNFFGCVGFHWVVDVFESVFNCEAGTAKILARLCTYGNFLPQGAPTSPYLANICALDLDEKIFQICRENFKDYEFDYSRYVDDITISGDRKLMFYLGDFYRAIKSCGFSANPKKLKIAKPSSRQKVTGVVVNKKLNAPKKLIRKIRQQLHYCTKYGLVNHCAHQKIEPDNFFQEIQGKIGYLRMTQPELADEFDIMLLRSIRFQGPEVADDDEEAKIELLNFTIDEERVVTFSYFDQRCRVAPTELFRDEDEMIMRGFQISPTQGWRRFRLLEISSLAVDDSNS